MPSFPGWGPRPPFISTTVITLCAKARPMWRPPVRTARTSCPPSSTTTSSGFSSTRRRAKPRALSFSGLSLTLRDSVTGRWSTMLSRRLAAVLTVKGGWVVQSIRFQRYLPVGRPEIAVEFLNQWGIDEIILLDIDASRERRRPDFEMVTRVSKKCFVPLTVGGGIRSVDHMRELIHRGADKVSLNSVLFEDREIIRKGAEVLGTQCIVVSMDVLRDSEQTYSVMKNSGSERTDWDPVSWAKEEIGRASCRERV